jgi:DNA mismatch endonuclease (patch repair protein)
MRINAFTCVLKGIILVDFLSPVERSRRMARIRGKDTAPEMALRRALHSLGLRFRLHSKELPGKPDLIFSRFKAIVFVHGCFWHRHPACKIATIPKSNTAFWVEKFEKNVARDTKTIELLKSNGWRVFVVWECELSTKTRTQEAAVRLAEQIRES